MFVDQSAGGTTTASAASTETVDGSMCWGALFDWVAVLAQKTFLPGHTHPKAIDGGAVKLRNTKGAHSYGRWWSHTNFIPCISSSWVSKKEMRSNLVRNRSEILILVRETNSNSFTDQVMFLDVLAEHCLRSITLTAVVYSTRSHQNSNCNHS